MYDLGLRIKQLRESRNMSQAELGRRIYRSKSVVCSYENNMKFPPLPVLTDIARVFHVSLDYLVGIDKQEMVSVEGLSPAQKKLMDTLIIEFRDRSARPDGLTPRQQEILNGLMKEFSRKNPL